MKEQKINETSLFTNRLPQTHAQDIADRSAVGAPLPMSR